MDRLSKGIFVVIVVIILSMITLRIVVVTNAMKDGKTVYGINVNSFNSHESYITKEYTRDKMTGCVTFKDEFGITRVVCNNYTITEY